MGAGSRAFAQLGTLFTQPTRNGSGVRLYISRQLVIRNGQRAPVLAGKRKGFVSGAVAPAGGDRTVHGPRQTVATYERDCYWSKTINRSRRRCGQLDAGYAVTWVKASSPAR